MKLFLTNPVKLLASGYWLLAKIKGKKAQVEKSGKAMPDPLHFVSLLIEFAIE